MTKFCKYILMILLLIMLVGCSNTIVKDDINNGLEDELVPSTELYWGIKDNTLYISAEETENATKVNSSAFASSKSDYYIPWWDLNLDNIGKVIIEKSNIMIVPVSMNNWFSYLTNCKSIEGLENIDTSLVIDMQGLFACCDNLAYLDLKSFDTSKVEDMGNMFFRVNLESLDLSSFDTSNVKDMHAMFHSSTINDLNLSSFDTSNVESMQAMFAYFETDFLDLSSFDTSNVEDMSFMFNWSRINKLDISSFNTSNVKNISAMFGSQIDDNFQPNDYFKSIDISHFDLSNAQDIDDISDLYAYTHY